MPKKTKRKVSSVTSTRQVIDVVAANNTSEVPVTPSAAPRTFSRRGVTSVQEFNPDYSYVKKDLKRIATLAGTFFVLLIALSFVLPLIVK